MAEDLFLRAGDNDRSRATSFLSNALEKGFISTDELHLRLEKAIGAKTYNDLLEVVADIPGGRSLVKEIASGHIVTNHSQSFPDFRPPFQNTSTYYRQSSIRQFPIWTIPIIFAMGFGLFSFAGIVLIPFLFHLLFFNLVPFLFIGALLLRRVRRRSRWNYTGKKPKFPN